MPWYEVTVLPGGHHTTVEAIEPADGPSDKAFPSMSVVVRLSDKFSMSPLRGRGGFASESRRSGSPTGNGACALDEYLLIPDGVPSAPLEEL
jgi:sulfate adenylyltransferase subunit 1 (EFTu-like GTPase family)